jgi:hypothetical protein
MAQYETILKTAAGTVQGGALVLPAGTTIPGVTFGVTLLYGSGAPAPGTGVDGAFYLDYTNSVLYGPKASGSWPAGVSLIGSRGATGAAGNTIWSGSGAPSVLTGADGDWYIDTTTHYLYGPRVGWSWPAGVALIGADGAGFQTWTAPDLDTGTEILVEWDAPTANSVWKVVGQISKAASIIAFEALVVVGVSDDGYGGYTYTTVEMTVQHTAEIGDCSAVTWKTGSTLYTDYDVTSGKVRLRANFASDNWAAAGTWIKAA